MLSRLSLSKKLMFMGIIIGLIGPALGMFTYFQSQKVGLLNKQISGTKLGKTKELGELVSKFRDIRLQVRTVPVLGMTWPLVDDYLEKTKTAVSVFSEAKKQYEAKLENEEERALYKTFDTASQEFLEFGSGLIALSSAHDLTKLAEVARQVRDICPVKALKVETAIKLLVENQTLEAKALVTAAQLAESQTNSGIVIASIVGFLFALGLGGFLARSISLELQNLANLLAQSSTEVSNAANQVSSNGSALSSSSVQQAATLQETVSAIEEISSMIQKNSENADVSKQSATMSLNSAQQGKEMVEELILGVRDIQKSSNDLMTTVEHGNQEIKKIVDVINEIETKTKVINDIVFQTKLLSFNASVEAARAGESGKGFTVVAEEVGNLAAMSGRSAKEISELLTKSVQMVNKIVASTQERIEVQSNESKSKISQGIELGNQCGERLIAILDGAHKVDRMMAEIAQASKEQSAGVLEISKAMNQIDETTQENSVISNSSAVAAEQLSSQASQMKDLVEQLTVTIRGAQSKLPTHTLEHAHHAETTSYSKSSDRAA